MSDVKIQQLKTYIKNLGSVLIAFSGGVDSTFLLSICKDVLGKDKVIAVTIKSNLIPEKEIARAQELSRKIDVKHMIVEFDESKVQGIYKNLPERCYHCKKSVFEKLCSIADDLGLAYVVDGTNFDDTKDFRPGLRALEELNIKSPLKEMKITKEDIRLFSKKAQIPNWDKPSMACLASRFPYGEKITKEKLKRVEKAEEILAKYNFSQFRVRSHKNLARIEILPDDMIKILDEDIRDEVVKKFKNIGFVYITLDLIGYRTGSMNEVLLKGETMV